MTIASKDKTSIPTRYLIIEDDLNLIKKNEIKLLQQYTYDLCSLYYDTLNSIKVPNVIKSSDYVSGKFRNY